MFITLLAAAILYPAVLLVLATGCGLAIDRLSGRWLPLAIVPSVGFAGLIALGQVTTTTSATAPLTVWVFTITGAGGYVLGRARLRAGIARLAKAPWVVVATLATYFISIAPVLLAGRPSLASYLTDTTTGTHLAGADYLIAHGREFAGLSTESGYGLQIRAYFDQSNYPSGGHVVLAGSAQLVPVRLTWLFQPYMSVALAMITPYAFVLLRRVGLGAAVSGALATIVSVPALVYALTLTGSIKEITALSSLMGLGALATLHKRWVGKQSLAAVPFGLLIGAGCAALGLPFAAWGLAAAGAIAIGVVGRSASRLLVGAFVRQAIVASAVAVVGAIAIVENYSKSAASANGIATTADPGNLLQPLNTLQAFGIWITGQYRFAPNDRFQLTYALIGAAIVLLPLGLLVLWRAKERVALSWLMALGLLWWQLTLKGSIWTDAKLILLSSPPVLFLACAGIKGLRGSSRTLAIAISGALIVGVLYSDARQYRETNLAPTARFDELAAINDRFSGQGPALLLDFDEFAFFELRDLEVSAPGFAYRSPGVASAGVPYGQSRDVDLIPSQTLAGQKLVIQRRSPTASRPPSDFRLAMTGDFYDVWTRDERLTPVADRLVSGGATSATSVLRCNDVKRIARRAASKGSRLIVARRAAVSYIPADAVARSPGFVGSDPIVLMGAGRVETTVGIPSTGTYEIWLRGQLGRKVETQIDGQPIGSLSEQTGGVPNFSTPLVARLAEGRHRLSLVRPGGSFRLADNAPSTLDAIVVSPRNNASQLSSVAPNAYERLCGRPVDWIEISEARG